MDLLTFAAGWLGWTQRETLRTDVNYVLAAVSGRVDMLNKLFGGPEDPPKPKRPTKEAFKQFVMVNNALMRKGKIRKAKKR